MYMLTQAKDYKEMNVLSSDQSVPCFQKLLDFVPSKLSKKMQKEATLHIFVLFFHTKELCQLNKVTV